MSHETDAVLAWIGTTLTALCTNAGLTDPTTAASCTEQKKTSTYQPNAGCSRIPSASPHVRTPREPSANAASVAGQTGPRGVRTCGGADGAGISATDPQPNGSCAAGIRTVRQAKAGNGACAALHQAKAEAQAQASSVAG